MVPLVKQARAGAVLVLVGLLGLTLGGCGGGGNGGAIGSLSVTLTRTVPTQTVTTTTPGVTTTQTLPAPVQTTASESSSSTPWGWIVLGVVLGLALLLGLILWRRHRSGAAAWGRQTAAFNRRVLVALDDVLAKGSVVTGQIEALASALETDRSLRLSTPPPTQEQLAYSTATIRQQAEELQGTIRPPSPTR